jgi:hypothetical protein
MEVKDEQVGGEEAGGQASINGNDGVPLYIIGAGGGQMKQCSAE